MPFCENCGAQMNGDFCTACGTRAKTSGAAPAAAAPQAGSVQAAPAVARKTSPIVWILVAVLGLFLLGGIAVVGGGLFLVHKAKQAGIDPELMRNNPGLATAKLLAATNPDLEVVSTDDQRGLITVRQKSTGKIMTVNFDEIKRGKITFREDGKDAVTLEAHGDGQGGAASLPAWIPAYPNSKPQSNFSINSKDGISASVQFTTQDDPKDILPFYERELKRNGFEINVTTNSGGASSSGLVSGEDQANKRTVLVSVAASGTGTTVSLTYSQK